MGKKAVDFGQVVGGGYTTECVESGSQGAAVLVGEATVQAVALKLELLVSRGLDDIAYSGHPCVKGSSGESRTSHSDLVEDVNAKTRHVSVQAHGRGRCCCGDRGDAVEREVSSGVGTCGAPPVLNGLEASHNVGVRVSQSNLNEGCPHPSDSDTPVGDIGHEQVGYARRHHHGASNSDV